MASAHCLNLHDPDRPPPFQSVTKLFSKR